MGWVSMDEVIKSNSYYYSDETYRNEWLPYQGLINEYNDKLASDRKYKRYKDDYVDENEMGM